MIRPKVRFSLFKLFSQFVDLCCFFTFRISCIQFINHFVDGTKTIDSDHELILKKKMLNDITLVEIVSDIPRVLDDGDCLVSVFVPDSDAFEVVTEDDIEKVVKAMA